MIVVWGVGTAMLRMVPKVVHWPCKNPSPAASVTFLQNPPPPPPPPSGSALWVVSVCSLHASYTIGNVPKRYFGDEVNPKIGVMTPHTTIVTIVPLRMWTSSPFRVHFVSR